MMEEGRTDWEDGEWLGLEVAASALDDREEWE